MPRRKIVLLVALPLLAAIVIFAIALITSPSAAPGAEFLEDLISEREDAVVARLSSDFQNVVHTQCPNGSASECVRVLIQPRWGELDTIHFVIGSGSRNTELYYTFWTNLSQPVSIVLIMSEENGREVIDGWRGFIVSEGENADGELLDGKRRDNELSTIR